MADMKWPRSFRSATALPTDQMATIIEQLIAELDRRDGDLDLEDDDPDTSAEDAPEGFDPEEDVGQDDIGEPTQDDEIQQMQHDVPCIPIYALEPNIFNSTRQLLGYTLPRVERDGEMEL